MARCYICDSLLQSVSFNRDHGDIDPCPTCLEVIADVFSDPPSDDESEEPSPEEIETAHEPDWRIDVV